MPDPATAAPPAPAAPSGAVSTPPRWMLVFGMASLALFFVFMMALIVASLWQLTIPPAGRPLVIILVSFAGASGSGFLGGYATLTGVFNGRGVTPLRVAVGGGVAVLVILLLLLSYALNWGGEMQYWKVTGRVNPEKVDAVKQLTIQCNPPIHVGHPDRTFSLSVAVEPDGHGEVRFPSLILTTPDHGTGSVNLSDKDKVKINRDDHLIEIIDPVEIRLPAPEKVAETPVYEVGTKAAKTGTGTGTGVNP